MPDDDPDLGLGPGAARSGRRSRCGGRETGDQAGEHGEWLVPGVLRAHRELAVGILVGVLAHHHVIGDAHQVDAGPVGLADDLRHLREVPAEPALQPEQTDCNLRHRPRLPVFE